MNHKLKCAIIQLSKFEDCTQSLMALKAAQQLYPNLEISIICTEASSEAFKKISWIKNVFPFSHEKMILPLLSKRKVIDDQVPLLADWLEPILDETFNLVINWTFSEASSYLTALLPAQIKLGYSRKKDGTLAILDGWSHYIYGVIQSDCSQEIHLTDILTTQLLTALQVHFEDPADPGKQSVTSKSFFKIERKEWTTRNWNHPGKRWITIQLGTDASEKNWTASDFAKFAAMILRRHDEQQIILCGTEKEKPLEKEFLKILKIEYPHFRDDRSRLISMVGKTDFDLWTQIISDSQWVISNKLSAIHHACVLGTRVISVLSSSIKYLEAGPYGNGHFLIRNANPISLYALWTYAHTEWQHKRELKFTTHAENLRFLTEIKNVEVYRSRIRQSEEGGGVVYEPLHTYEENLQRWEGRVWSYLARNWFCGWTPEVAHEVTRQAISPELLKNIRSLEDPLQVLGQLFEKGEQLSLKLYHATKNLKSETLMSTEQKSKVASLGYELKEVESLIHRTTHLHTVLTPFDRLHRSLLHNLEGSKINELSHSTSESYAFLKHGLKDVEAWLKETLKISRPVAVVDLKKDNVISIHRESIL